jgi:hypothetical protein
MTFKQFFDRYGPTLAVLLVLVILIVALPGNVKEPTDLTTTGGGSSFDAAPGGTTETTVGVDASGNPVDPGTASGTGTSGGGGTAGGTGSTGGGTATGGATPAAPGGAAAAPGDAVAPPRAVPKGVEFGTGPNCQANKRQKGIAVYMPPCVNWKPGTPNGGATARGVTEKAIHVTRFNSQVDPATEQALIAAGANDTDEVTARQYEAFFKYGNAHYETYGREVVLETIEASGPSDNTEAMKADAQRIANEKKAFLNFGGPNALAEELVQLGVVCMCTVSRPQEFYLANPPYLFSTLPTIDEYYAHIAEYVGKRLKGKPAKFTNDPTFSTTNRKFGLVYLEGNKSAVDPLAKKARDFYVRELAKYGVELSADAGYIGDTASFGTQASSIVSKMRAAGVSNILFIGDPLMPIFMTQQATSQAWFPEWFISGTALIDTTFFGRTYDKNQWNHAFGISPLYVFWTDVSTSSGYREFHHGLPGHARGDEGVSVNVARAAPQLIFIAIHMAGPDLTADNLARGMFNYPRSGGTPANPLSYFTREAPTQYKDFTEVFWDAATTGKDETSKDGAGALLKVDQGARHALGTWPATDPKVFVKDGTQVYTSDNPPGGRDPNHEQDGHTHDPKKACLSCTFPPSG